MENTVASDNLKYKGKRFDKAPLVEAVCEIRFPLNLAVDSYKHKFYDIAKGTFPSIELPPPVPFEHHVTQVLNYYSPDRSQNLVCSVSKFAYITRVYKTYFEFKKDFLIFANSFCANYNIIEINRMGLRFINQLSIPLIGDSIPLSKYMNFGFSLPSSISVDSIKDFQTVLTFQQNGHTIRSVIGTSKKEKESSALLTIDNDLIITGTYNVKDLESLLEKAHNDIENLFLRFMTEQYLQSIYPKEVKNA